MSSFNCSPVLSGSDAKDGGLPLTLALNISFATVRQDNQTTATLTRLSLSLSSIIIL